MFNYFPDNYAWSLTVLIALDNVGAISEIDDGIRHLKEVSGSDLNTASNAWYEAWCALGERLEGLAEQDESRGAFLSAGRKYYRASVYFLMAERFMSHTDPRMMTAYRRGLSNFTKATALRCEPLEFVEVPYEGKFLPSLFIKAPGDGPAPCMILFGGFDSVKEWSCPVIWRSYYERGISLMAVDQPGVGGALRIHGIPAIVESERPAAAIIDYLDSRTDVDSKRIGLMGVSLGGYYAPRAAAFEKRISAAIAWGGIWDFGSGVIDAYMDQQDKPRSIPNFLDYGMWAFGVDSHEKVIAKARQMTLEGVADKITCPLLVMHGENDRQVQPWVSQKTYDEAVNSSDRELKVFTPDIGGIEHCHADNILFGIDYMADWAARVLGGTLSGEPQAFVGG